MKPTTNKSLSLESVLKLILAMLCMVGWSVSVKGASGLVLENDESNVFMTNMVILVKTDMVTVMKTDMVTAVMDSTVFEEVLVSSSVPIRAATTIQVR